MIITELANSNPIATTDKASAILQCTTIRKREKPITNTVCICDCEYYQKVFSEAGPVVTAWKNDKTTLIFKKLINADYADIELYKNSEFAAIISNSTYGVYTDFGGFTNQPKYKEFVADWNKIYNALGAGIYYFKITTSTLGEVSEDESIKYQLMLYSDEKANGTVRIDTYNTGTILNSDFDYNSLKPKGFYQSIRISGKLLPKQPKYEKDNYLDSNYNILQLQDKIINEWTLETGLLPSALSNQIIYDMLLSNTIIISDYNAFNEEQIRELSVVFDDMLEKEGYKDHYYRLKFKEKKQNIIKNNF
jgi:hypothetical protein